MLQPKKKRKNIKKKSDNPADSYPLMKDETGAPMIGGGEGTTPPFTRKEMEYKKKMTGLPRGKMGKTVSKAKNGKSFPDLNKDGKITKADILKGRGVIAKKGATIKKAQYGGKAASMVPMKNGGGMHKMPDGSMMKNSKMKMGGTIKKAQTGNAIIDKASKDYKSYSAGTGPKPALSSGFKNGGKMKMGGSMKKCKYGCK